MPDDQISLIPSFSEDRLQLSDRAGRPVLGDHLCWLELVLDQQVHTPSLRSRGQGLAAEIDGLHLTLGPASAAATGSCTWLAFELHNATGRDRQVNLRWSLRLAGGDQPRRWLIPALIYHDPALEVLSDSAPGLTADSDVRRFRSPRWLFRADLAAVPMAMAWTGAGTAAMGLDEQVAGQLSAIGIDQRPGQAGMIAAWPYREEPRQRARSFIDERVLEPVLTCARLGPGERVRIPFWVSASGPSAGAGRAGPADADAYAFAPLLRESFARLDPLHALRPWFASAEAARHAAYGLHTWHYDAGHAALWGTCFYDYHIAENPRQVHRWSMHTGFVSGTPYAGALRRHGLESGQAEMAEAGRRVLDNCCAHLTPWGFFWPQLNKQHGWGSSWPHGPYATPGFSWETGRHQELQGRTIADACLFAAQWARAEQRHADSRELWTRATRSTLDHVLATMRPDGNPGGAYAAATGEVLYWDGEEGLHWIAALVEGARLTGEERYREAALRIGEHYRPAVERAWLTGAPEGMHRRPTSEDPLNGVIAYVRLWQETGERRWLGLACSCAELLMTFRWQYNTRYHDLTLLGRYDHRTKGYDISSPDNVHLHPYGLAAIREFVQLWEATGDRYLALQTRNNLQACLQMLAPFDGVFDARRGMMSERWFQSPDMAAKGGTMQASHAWALGLVLLASQWLHEVGHVLIDGATGEAIALDVLTLEAWGGGWLLVNPWDAAVSITIAVRAAGGTLLIAGEAVPGPGRGQVLRHRCTIAGHASCTLSWKPALG